MSPLIVPAECIIGSCSGVSVFSKAKATDVPARRSAATTFDILYVRILLR